MQDIKQQIEALVREAVDLCADGQNAVAGLALSRKADQFLRNEDREHLEYLFERVWLSNLPHTGRAARSLLTTTRLAPWFSCIDRLNLIAAFDKERQLKFFTELDLKQLERLKEKRRV